MIALFDVRQLCWPNRSRQWTSCQQFFLVDSRPVFDVWVGSMNIEIQSVTSVCIKRQSKFVAIRRRLVGWQRRWPVDAACFAERA